MILLMIAATSLSLSLFAQNAPVQTNAVSGIAITNLIQHKQEYQGKRVEVRGYYRGSFEFSQVSDGRSLGPAEKSLWVAYWHVKPGCEANVRATNGVVRIVGRFNFRPGLGCGHLGSWPAEITDVEVFGSLE